jgi:uncharacterized membrane protein
MVMMVMMVVVVVVMMVMILHLLHESPSLGSRPGPGGGQQRRRIRNRFQTIS